MWPVNKISDVLIKMRVSGRKVKGPRIFFPKNSRLKILLRRLMNHLLSTERLRLCLFCNLIFLVYFLHSFLVYPQLFFSLICNLLIFVIPGLPWVGSWVAVRKNGIGFVFCNLLFSTIILIFGIGIFSICHIPVKPLTFLLYLIVITNLGLMFGKTFGFACFMIPYMKLSFSSVAIFLLIYCWIYIHAVYRVPPQKDSDIELQGTAYSLIHFGKPHMLTDRGTVYYFAHPLLVHVYSAFTILFTDTLDDMKYYYDFASEGQKILDSPLYIGEKIVFSVRSGGTLLGNIIGLEEEKVAFDQADLEYIETASHSFIPVKGSWVERSLVKKQKLWPLVQMEYERFKQNPFLLSTRMPHIFVSSLSAVVLLMIIYHITRSLALSLTAPFLYFSFPRMTVWSSSELYTAISQFSLFVCAYFYLTKTENEKERSMFLFFAVFYAALVNHKTVIFPLAVIVRELLISQQGETWRNVVKRVGAHEAVIGFVAGTAIFWIYGMWIDVNAFITDHFKYHLWHRIFHINELGYQGYPNILQLWVQFSENSGKMFIVLSCMAIIYLMRAVCRKENRETIFPIWCIVGAVIFSVVDWRETLHLSLIFPAIMVSVFLFLSKQRQIVKCLCYMILIYCFVRNMGHPLIWNF